MPERVDFFDVVYTTRAIRKFRPDPVPPGLVRQVLEAATQAPSGANQQPWAFVVVHDPRLKRKLGEYYRDGFAAYRGVSIQQLEEEAEGSPNSYLAVHFCEAPVIVLVCSKHSVAAGDTTGGAISTPASVFPAVQNLLLAARAVGLGGVLTTNHRFHHDEVKKFLGIPDDVTVFTMVPLGFPAQRHGRKSRQPVEEVTYQDRWGNPARF